MIPAAAAAVIARFSGISPPDDNGWRAVAQARINELETERDKWLHICEELDEENERLRTELKAKS